MGGRCGWASPSTTVVQGYDTEGDNPMKDTLRSAGLLARRVGAGAALITVSMLLTTLGMPATAAGEHGPSPLQQGTLTNYFKTTEQQVPDPTDGLQLSTSTIDDPAYDGTLTTVQSTTTGPATVDGVDSRTSKCFYITATARYAAPVGPLWYFTSRATICWSHIKVTYYNWMTPTWHVTNAGQLAGWQFKSQGHAKNRIGPCKVVGDSWGKFIQTYPVIGQIGSQIALHHLTVTCDGYRWGA